MRYIFAFIAATVGYIFAINHLQQTFLSYYDYVAFVVVFAGIFAVALMTIPKIKWATIGDVIAVSIFRGRKSKHSFLNDCISVAAGERSFNFDDPKVSRRSEYRILRDGLELVSLNFKQEKISSILEERILFQKDKMKKVSNWLRSLSKYPPAFGLSATVLGLIHLMRGISDGMDAKETGIRMAIALIATFYGLVVANLLINPLGEAVYQQSIEEEEFSIIAMKTILMLKEKNNLLEIQEELNSHAEELDRVDVINTHLSKEMTQ